jgi:SET domain-containing protein
VSLTNCWTIIYDLFVFIAAALREERIRLRIREPSIRGKGVFTLHKIHRNTHVLTFHGERISSNSNAIQAAHKKHGTDGVGFLFALDSQYVLDGSNVDCKARFLNHCCMVGGNN